MTVQQEAAIQLAVIDARLGVLTVDRIATIARRVAWLAAGDIPRVRQEDGRVLNLDREIGYLIAERGKWAVAFDTGILTIPLDCFA